MPKLMVTAVGFSSRTWAWKRPAPPLAVSPPMPALRNVRFHSGNRVVRYSSMSVEYWYCSVMLSPRKTMRSPGLKKKPFSGSAARGCGRVNRERADDGGERGGEKQTAAVLASWEGDEAELYPPTHADASR